MLEILNDSFNESCEPGYDNYKKYKDILIVEDFFKNFDLAKNFFRRVPFWDTKFSTNNKPGLESFLPPWVGKVLLEKYFKMVNHQQIDDSISTCVNVLYKEKRKKTHISSLSTVPHTDSYPINQHVIQGVVLINLNDFPITTNFWSFDNQMFVHSERDKTEYNNFLIEYEKNMKDLEKYLKTEYSVQYNPNTLIYYPSNIYHSALIEDFHTQINPRVSLCIRYDFLNKKSMNYF